LGYPLTDFSASRHPGSPGLRLPGAFPFPALGLDGRLRYLDGARKATCGPPRSLSTPGHGLRASPLLSGTSGTHPYWVMLPVLQSFKELGSWLTSSEVAGPLRFLSSSPAQERTLELGCRTSGCQPLSPMRQRDSRSSSERDNHLDSRSSIAERRAPLVWLACLSKTSPAF
jgi:hypothetical protein